MRKVLENIYGQPAMRELLDKMLTFNKLSQAYLFVGPSGSNKLTAALSFAAALICEDGGCNSCDACKKILRGTHPDVRVVTPQGAQAYLVEQVREIVSDISLAPILSSKKIYILDEVDRMNASAANAFLKSLEEPPDDVVFILLARTKDAVLSTLVSRCQLLTFRQIPTSEAIGILQQNIGAAPQEIEVALAAGDGSLRRAAEYLRNPSQQVFRQKIIETLFKLKSADDLDVLDYARDLVQAASAPLDVVRQEFEEELERQSDFIDSKTQKRLQDQHKRSLTSKSLHLFLEMNSIFASSLRDAIMILSGTPELILNKDHASALQDFAAGLTIKELVAAQSALTEMKKTIVAHVSPETVIDVLLYEIREALYGAHSSSWSAI